MQFIFINDPGHGWLLVTRRELAELGLSERDISPYSYQRGQTLALEEDLDASTFLNAWLLKNRRLPEIVERSGSPRGWQPYGKRVYSDPRPDLEAQHRKAMALRQELRAIPKEEIRTC